MAVLDLHFSECIDGSVRTVFERVVDVAAYPSFLPYCQKTEVVPIDDARFLAKLWLAKGWISVSFESLVVLDPYQNIYMSSESGPFKSLKGSWSFIEKSESQTQADLSVSVDFFSYWQKQMLMPLASTIGKELISAFVRHFSKPLLTAEQGILV